MGTYAAFLKDIYNHDERQQYLELARANGLDVHLITQCVVRLATYDKTSEREELPAGAIGSDDNNRIAALEWLMFNPVQRAHALRYSNKLTRRFIIEKKLIAARRVQESLPEDSVALIKQSYQSKKQWKANTIREHLSLRTYLQAVVAYEAWAHIFYKQPQQPPPLPAGSLASQEIHWVKQQAEYQQSQAQWKEKAVKRADEALKALFAVLAFPLGWLKDESATVFTSSNLRREHELQELRKICVPQIFIFCHTVLHETQQYQACLELAGMVADETQALYKDFSADELRAFLALLHKSSLAALAG